MEQSNPSLPDKIPISRKSFKKIIMPSVGDVICDGLFKVEYVHYGKFRFSASYRTIPPTRGHIINLDDRKFVIDYLAVVKKRFGASFKGFTQPEVPLPEAPEQEIAEDLVKVI